MTNSTKIKIAVLGSKNVGKTAIVVRFLTKRFIGDYTSGKDLFYKKMITLDDGMTYEVEILDVSQRTVKSGEELHEEHIRWADGFLIVYSIKERESFEQALRYAQYIKSFRGSLGSCPIHIVGNMADHEGESRQVSLDEAHERSLRIGYRLSEVSAAESHVGVSTIFQSVLKDIRSLRCHRSLPRHRKLSIVGGVSRVFGSMFSGKFNNSTASNHGGDKTETKKRRTSFSL